MSIYDKISKRCEQLYDEAVSLRRQLHRWPEEGFKEHKTSAFVLEYLKNLGIDGIRTGIAKTGIVADIKGAGSGPTIAIRADMDGLPITEKTGLAFSSEHEGWMHGCGHDAHVAGLMVTAKVISELKGELSGTARLLFQPAEEGPGGAEPMVAEGAMDGVDTVIGGHVWGDNKPGEVALKPGPLFAAPDEFRITIHGVGGHAAAPHTAVDTVPILANMLNALQTIVSRRIEPGVPCVVTVGTVQSGYRYNVIADTSSITGTVRTFDPSVQATVKKAMQEICCGIAQSMGASAELEYIDRYPCLVNNGPVTDTMRELAVRMLGEANVVEAKPTMGGEDFAYYLKKAPGTFMFIGSANEDGAYWNDAHHPRFNIDERALLTMTKLYSAAPFWFGGARG